MDGTRIVIQCPAMPGKLIITADETKDNSWIASRRGFDPYEVEAIDLAGAVQQVMLNIHMFSRTSEYKAKKAAAKALRAERERVETQKSTRREKRETVKPEVASV